MGDRLATIDVGQKLGARGCCALFRGGGEFGPHLMEVGLDPSDIVLDGDPAPPPQCSLGRGLPPYEVAS